MAFTGIATALLPKGMTVRKVLGLPVPLLSDSSFNIAIKGRAIFQENRCVYLG